MSGHRNPLTPPLFQVFTAEELAQLQVATTVAQEPPFEADELTWAVEASGRLPCELS